ncbi:hypothetical protein E1200_28400, partial [Actinomadura sp. GC306]
MSESPHAPGRATRESADEPSMEWLGELKSDADDPELQPVNPSVTQAFEAMLEEAKPAAPLSAPPQASPQPPLSAPPAGIVPEPPAAPQPVVQVDPTAQAMLRAAQPRPDEPEGPAEGPEQEFARALAEESPAAAPADSPTATNPGLDQPDLNQYATPPPAGSGTG